MARLVYACRFEIPGAEAWESIVVPAYETWVKDRYSRAHGAEIAIDMRGASVTGSLPPHHALSIDAYEVGGVARRINWEFPGDQGLIWTNMIRMASLADYCVVEYQIHLQSANYLVAPASFSLGAPAVVRSICQQHPVSVGDMRLRATVYPLALAAVAQVASPTKPAQPGLVWERPLPTAWRETFCPEVITEVTNDRRWKRRLEADRAGCSRAGP